ncbi:MAG TPA: kelch repeat-containing protein [Bryobacteraceae bacterium]|nr:kelch repeat-containing protein [Bryobacteraceae bacterium]
MSAFVARISRIDVLILVLLTAHIASAQSWTQLSPSGDLPPGRGFNGSSAVYDPSSNEMVVFGGRDSNGNNLNDVWILTNANGQGSSQWVNLIPNGADGSPPARSGHSAVYDAVNNRMMIFGGCSGYCAPALNDVWVLTNANGQGGTPSWTEISSSVGPAARTNSAVVYDPAHNDLVVFGGQDGSENPCSTFSDLWTLSHANGLGGSPLWQRPLYIGPVPIFPGQNAPSVAFDPTTEVMTVFGGTGMVNGSCRATNAVSQVSVGNIFAPTWQSVLSDGAAGSPPARYLHSAVYDATGGRMLVFGGSDGNGNYFNDVWSLSNATGFGSPVWTKLTPSGGPPPARGSQAVVFDSVDQLMTVFGGNNASTWLNDTWVLPAPGISGLSCSALASPSNIRSEGLAERLGDQILQCTGGTPTPQGQPIPQYTVTLKLNTNVTSRPLPIGRKLSEALLMIDEPFPQSPIPSSQSPYQQEPPQILCKPLGKVCQEIGTDGSPSPYQSQPNVFVGAQTGANSLQWTVPIDPPGVNIARYLRITNVRVNALELGPPPPLPQPVQVLGTVTVAGSQQVPLSGSQTTLGSAQSGAIASASGNPSLPVCVAHNASLEGASGAAAFDFNVQVQEVFPFSFRVRNYGSILFGPSFPPEISEQNVPGYPYYTETGFYVPSLITSAPEIGLADSGTRILVKFASVQPKVHLFVPVTITTQPFMSSFFGMPGQLQLVTADQNGASSPGYVPVKATAMVGTTPVAEVTYNGGDAFATYEVVYDDPAVAELATIPVAIAFRKAPHAGATTVNASLAPQSTIGTADASAPVPRYGALTATQPAYSLFSCPAKPLTGSIVSKTGPSNARVWTIDVSAPGSAASAAQIEGFTLTQTKGAACAPTIVSPASFPIALGDIPANGKAQTQITTDFSSCGAHAKFSVQIPLAADQGIWTGSIEATGQLP